MNAYKPFDEVATKTFPDTATIATKKINGYTFKWTRLGNSNSITCHHPGGYWFEVLHTFIESEALATWRDI